jgi:hypothetical protein
MNRRRQLLSAIGFGSLFAGVTAAVPRRALAATEKPRPTFPSTPPLQHPEYKVFSVPAGDRVEDVFNAVAREGFQYAGSTQRYGHTEFIFVKWVSVGPITPGELS